MIVIDADPAYSLPAAITLVIVEAAGVAFALRSDTVAQVTAQVPVTPLPLVPAFVDGLVGIGGGILPQIDLRRRLGLPPPFPADPADLLVMVATDGNYALRVDHVIALITIERDTIQVFDHHAENNAPALDALPAEMVTGEFPWRQRTVLMLNADRVGLQDVHPVNGENALTGPRESSAGIGSASAAPPPAEIHHIYVLARSGPGMFALPVEQVAEVVPAGPMTRMPGAPADVIGITQLRGRPLPVLMPAVLATGPAESGTGVLMVINAAAGRFALRVDAVAGIRRFPLSRIHAGAETESGAEGRAGYLIDPEQRVIGLLDADRMTAASGAAAWRALLPPAEKETPPAVAPPPTRKLLLFRVGAEWCGFDAASVMQLTGWRPLLPVPETVTDLAGLIEIGADVLPVIDLRIVMGVPADIDEWTTLIILRDESDGTRWVAVSDRIDRLVTVPATDLQSAEAPPHPLIAAVVRVGDRMVSVLDAASLFRST